MLVYSLSIWWKLWMKRCKWSASEVEISETLLACHTRWMRSASFSGSWMWSLMVSPHLSITRWAWWSQVCQTYDHSARKCFTHSIIKPTGRLWKTWKYWIFNWQRDAWPAIIYQSKLNKLLNDRKWNLVFFIVFYWITFIYFTIGWLKKKGHYSKRKPNATLSVTYYWYCDSFSKNMALIKFIVTFYTEWKGTTLFL